MGGDERQKSIYQFLKQSNNRNKNFLKDIGAYANVFDSYGENKPVHPSLFKAKIS